MDTVEPHPSSLEETSVDELISAWKQQFGMSHEECRQHVNRVLCSLLKTLEEGEDRFFLPLNNEYAIMVEKKSEKALALTKIQVS